MPNSFQFIKKLFKPKEPQKHFVCGTPAVNRALVDEYYERAKSLAEEDGKITEESLVKKYPEAEWVGSLIISELVQNNVIRKEIVYKVIK